MIRLLADENFSRPVVRGVLARNPAADLVTAQDAGLTGTSDPDLLAWAATEGRIVLTHDVQTLVGFAYDRIVAGLPMPGVAVAVGKPVAVLIDEILLAVAASTPDEWIDQVKFLPIR